MPTVVLLGTLDTKGREYAYVKSCLHEAGVSTLMIDFGIMADSPFAPDISADAVAAAGGADLADLRAAHGSTEARTTALGAMTRGLTRIVTDLHADHRCDAVFGLGGSSGSSVVSAVMQALPLGVPKLLLSTMASGDVKPYVGTRDICLMYSVTDIAGLNRISRPILRNAAYAIAGMAQAGKPTQAADRPLIAITMMGITTTGALHIIELLEAAGFETIVFHANGSGQAMEELIADGLIDGVIEYALRELTAYAFGGEFHAGPQRLEAAAHQGIPQVIVPGGIEVLNFGPRDTVPEKYDHPDRKIIIHNPAVCAVRINEQESAHIGELLAKKVNATVGLATVLLPLNGMDMYQEPPDGPWIDTKKDAVLFDAIRSHLRADIPLIELNAYINDREFANATVEAFLKLWSAHQSEKVV